MLMMLYEHYELLASTIRSLQWFDDQSSKEKTMTQQDIISGNISTIAISEGINYQPAEARSTNTSLCTATLHNVRKANDRMPIWTHYVINE